LNASAIGIVEVIRWTVIGIDMLRNVAADVIGPSLGSSIDAGAACEASLIVIAKLDLPLLCIDDANEASSSLARRA